MKAVLKFLVVGTGLFLIGLTLAALLLSARIETFARGGLERGLSAGLGVPVRIDGLDASPVEEALIVRGLHVGMPEGFGEGDALYSPSVLVSINTRSVLAGNPVVRLIRVDAPEVTMRHEIGRGVNLAPLLGGPVEADAGGAAGEGFLIERIEIREGRLVAGSGALPAEANAALPAVIVENVRADGALSAANALRAALRAALGGVLTGNAASPSAFGDFGAAMWSLAEGLGAAP